MDELLTSRGRWGRRRRERLIRRRRGRRRAGPAALRRTRLVTSSGTHVLLLQRARRAEGDVPLVPGRRAAARAAGANLFSTARLVLVIRMLALVNHPEPVGLLDERLLVGVGQESATDNRVPTVRRGRAIATIDCHIFL